MNRDNDQFTLLLLCSRIYLTQMMETRMLHLHQTTTTGFSETRLFETDFS